MEKMDKKISSILKSNKYIVPAITIFLCISFSTAIAVLVQSLMSKSNKVTIATSLAEEEFYNGNYSGALKEYEKLQEKDEWPIWNVKIAEIYSVQGDFVKSNEILQKAYDVRNKLIDKNGEEKYEERDRELTNYIVFTSLMNGENKKALEYGELFLKDYPSDKKLLRTMFTVYMVNTQVDKAKQIVNEYPRENETASDLATLARMNMLVDNWDDGFKLLKDAWEMDENEPKVFDVIAQINAYNKDSIIDKIVKLQKDNPDEIAYKMWMAKIYSMSSEASDEAMKIIDELENTEASESVNLMLIKANVYQNINDNVNSQQILNKVINNQADSFIGYHTAAWQAYNSGKYDEALNNCKKSILINKDYPDNYGFLIPEIMEKQDKTKEAEPYFRTALYKEPFNYNIMIKIAEYYWNTMKDSTKSIYYYDLAAKIKPADGELYYNMALININNQRLDDGIKLLTKSIKLDESTAKYYRTLGTVYLNMQKNDEAIKAIRNAYAIDKNDILTLNNAGCYYISIEGNVERGMINLKAAYDGINGQTSANDKEIITDNYNKAKELYDAYNKRDGATLSVPDFKLFY